MTDETKYFLNVIAYTPVGTFAGTINTIGATEDEIKILRDGLQTNVGNTKYLVLLTNTTEMLFPEALIENSMFQFSIANWSYADTESE